MDIEAQETQNVLVAKVVKTERRARAAREAEDAARTEVQTATTESMQAWTALRDFQDRLVQAEMDR